MPDIWIFIIVTILLRDKKTIKEIQAMQLTAEKKQELFSKHGFAKKKTDTGSPESQIAMFTTRINDLTLHLKGHKKDFSTQQGLIKLVGQRKRLLNYLQRTNITRYRSILAELELRK